MSVRKMKGNSSKRSPLGATTFQTTQAATKTVMPMRKPAVPMRRAKRSERTPKASCENDSVRQHPRALLLRLVELVAAHGTRAGAALRALAHRCAPISCRSSRQSSGRMWSSTSSTVTAPMSRPSSSTTGSETRL